MKIGEEEFVINMTKEEMLKFYVNKIVEDGIRECYEFNTSIYLNAYGDGIDLTKYKDEILQLLYRDERIADVTINNEMCIDMVFYTSYCPYFYDEVYTLDSKEQSEILSDFYYYSSSRVFENGYSSIRSLIDGFVNNKDEDSRDDIYNVLKKNIIETGFIDKYIEDSNETFVTLENKKEFEKMLHDRIKTLEQNLEAEEEFE